MNQATVKESTQSRVPAWVWFVAWIFVGVGFMFALLGAMTIGVFVLPVAGGLAALVATRRGSIVGIPGLISGASLPLFYVAYLNRDGPGNVCRSFADGGSACTEEWSPLPWLFVGVVLLLGGVAVFVSVNRKKVRSDDASTVV
jgi:hypothetical protein